MFDKMHLRALHIQLKFCSKDLGPFIVNQGYEVESTRMLRLSSRPCFSFVDVWAQVLLGGRMFVGADWHFSLNAAVSSYQHYVSLLCILLQLIILATGLSADQARNTNNKSNVPSLATISTSMHLPPQRTCSHLQLVIKCQSPFECRDPVVLARLPLNCGTVPPFTHSRVASLA